MIEEHKISRRKVITGLGAGLTVAAVSPAFAVEGISEGRSFTLALEDPRGKYPKPPFKEQFQPWPGLASKMDPVPDHGEKSYRGSGRLKGRKALITGGTQAWEGQQLSLTPGKVLMWQ